MHFLLDKHIPTSFKHFGSKKSSVYYSSYSKAVKDFENSLNKPDADLLCKVVLPYEQYQELDKKRIDSINDDLSNTLNFMKAFDKNYKYKFKIKGKTKLDDDSLDELYSYYSYYFKGNCPKIEEGYQLKIEFSALNEKDTIYFDVIFFSNNGWRVSEKAMNSSFSIPSSIAGSGGGGFDY